MTNKILPGYTRKDLALSDGVTVEEVFTTGSGLDRNSLETFMETVRLKFTEKSSITYVRLNHKDFTFNIKINNPQGSTKKVIIRIFLGLSKDKTFKPKRYEYGHQDSGGKGGKGGFFKKTGMVEMERFVIRLSGESSQVIIRKSTENHLKFLTSKLNKKLNSSLKYSLLSFLPSCSARYTLVLLLETQDCGMAKLTTLWPHTHIHRSILCGCYTKLE